MGRHSGKHGGDEDERLDAAKGECRERRAGAEAREAPADPEEESAHDKRTIDRMGLGAAEAVVEKGSGPTARQAKAGAGDQRSPRHHEGEARIPAPGKIEKGEDLGRVDHARDDQPQAEEEAAQEGHEHARHGAQSPARCRTTKTVAIPAAMKASVAASERRDRRASPHTPCPLVQPLPSRVPKPTRRPATASVGSEASMVTRGRLPVKSAERPGAASMPITKATRQARSPLAALPIPPTIPLMPAMRPFASHKSAAASPISAPPSDAERGVKFSQAILSTQPFLQKMR